jgi:hypothetical protein
VREQLLDGRVELVAVLEQDAAGLGVALVADATDLLVDGVEQLVGHAGHAGLAVAGEHRDGPIRSDISHWHSPPAGHRPRDAGAGLEVAVGAGRHDLVLAALVGDDRALHVGVGAPGGRRT